MWSGLTVKPHVVRSTFPPKIRTSCPTVSGPDLFMAKHGFDGRHHAVQRWLWPSCAPVIDMGSAVHVTKPTLLRHVF